MAVKFKDTININGQYTLPLTDGTDGQVLVTDGSGNLTFSSESIAGSADSAESTHLNVKNTSGASIAKGTPVYVTGSVGNTDKLEIAPANASNASHMPAIGLLESTLADNGEGFVVQGGLLKGLVTDTIDGSASAANDTVYVKAGGGLTLTKPTGSTNFIQNIAKVARVHNGNGSLIVSSILRTNDVPNLSTGKIWVGDSNTIESTVVHIDETNGRVGIGTDSPSTILEIEDSGANLLDLTRTNVGTYRLAISGNDRFSIYDVGADEERLSIDSSGNVGIGTDSPSELLHIHTGDSGGVANNAADEVLVEGSGDTGITISSPSTNIGTLAFGDNDVSLRGAVRYDHSNDSMDFRVSSNTRMTIDSSGNATFTGNLTVGDGHFIGDDSFDNLLLQAGGTGNLENLVLSASNDLIFYTGGSSPNSYGTQRLRIFNSDGRAYFTNSVGIGTDGPTESLHVLSSGNISRFESTTATSNVVIENSTTTTKIGSVSNNFVVDLDPTDSVASSNIILKSDGTERARFKSSGDISFRDTSINEAFYWDASTARLGIGTTSPLDLLHIKSTTTDARLFLDGSVDSELKFAQSGTVKYSIGHDAGTGNFVIGTTNVDTEQRLVIDSSGNVGIGTDSPAANLDILNGITGASLKLSATTTAYWQIQRNSTTGNLNISDDALGNVMSFDQLTGNVGIGTDSPDTLLDVAKDGTGNDAPIIRITNKKGIGNWSAVTDSMGKLEFYSDDSSGNAPYATGFVSVENDFTTGAPTLPSGALVFGTATYNASGGAVERMRIDSSGRVGIGISSGLTYPLTIQGETGVNNSYVHFVNATTGTAFSDGTQIGVPDGQSYFLINQRESSDIRINVGGSERMRIVSGGGIQIPNVNATNEIQFTGTEYSNIYSATTAGFDIGTNSSSGTSYLRLLTENTERVRIDSSGRVGIGMTPSNYSGYMLQINGGTQSFMSFGNSTTGTGALNGLVIGNDSTGADIYQREEQPLRFHTNNTERMRIDSSGIVTGTITDDSFSDVDQLILKRIWSTGSSGDRSHGIALKDANSTMARIYADRVNSGTNYKSDLVFITNTGATGTDTSEKMRIDSSGNVGIGTTSPGGKLDIKTPMGTSGRFDGAQLRLESTNTVDTTGFQGIRFATSTTPNYGWSMGANRSGSGRGSFRFFEHINSITGVERFTIKQDGNVGIGTTNPAYKLDISGSLRATTGIFLGNISTSGSVLFNDNQGINFGNSNAKIYGSSTDGIKFNGGGSEKMRLTQAGNVGIGTTNPGVALDVVGAIRATGDVTAFHSSDERLKANKKIIENATDKIEQIGGYEFDWVPKEGVHINEGHDIGVIAQEVEKVIPEVVVTRDNGYKAVKYEKLVPLLIEAVKELSEKVKILENK